MPMHMNGVIVGKQDRFLGGLFGAESRIKFVEMSNYVTI